MHLVKLVMLNFHLQKEKTFDNFYADVWPFAVARHPNTKSSRPGAVSISSLYIHCTQPINFSHLITILLSCNTFLQESLVKNLF